MKIYFFTRNLETGLIYAGCKANGKRFTAPVWKQGKTSYVTTGAAITKDVKRHTFTSNQEEALSRFIASSSQNMEDWRGIE